MNDGTYGRTTYEAFARQLGWRSPQGEPMPLWEELSHHVQHAWDVASEACTDAYFADADPPEDSVPASGDYWIGT